jgi:hypothetical protein
LLNDTPMPGSGRLVERDQRVAERDEQQQLGEVEHLVAEPSSREHHPDAVPGDDDRREGHEQLYPNRMNSGSYVSSRFVIACWIVGNQIERRLRHRVSASSYGWRQVRSASPAPATNASLAAGRRAT